MTDSYLGNAKYQRLVRRMRLLHIHENDLVEKFVLGSGRGGQKLNKTSSCVQLKHSQSGIIVKCRRTRSRSLNRYYARVELCDRYEENILKKLTERKQKEEKIRRQKRRRSRRQKEQMLLNKHKQSDKKALRRSINQSDE
ncbi:MAG: peptide chain release factor-like protein [Lentisphaerae bacterium]|nr:peptide chain release factor-like protein [Lentisphaerota bacterium]